jgi:Glycosyl hydrolases family 2, TIM barrel domain
MLLEQQKPLLPFHMSNINKTILRTVLMLSYVLIIGLVVYGIASVYSYLNTGADRSKMLHTEVQKIDQYLPQIQWQPLTNEGRPMDQQTLKAIESDYLDAWYAKHIAYKTNTKEGIKDYFTERSRENIYNNIDLNSQNNTTIDATTLSHNPKLEFFSEDGQLVVLTDYDVVEYKRVYKDQQLILEVTETSDYRVTILLEDGFWRIRHMVKLDTEPFKEEANQKSVQADIKGINYYPQATAWNMYGDNFDADIIASDFELIRSSGLNTIRVFVPYESFGKANVDTDKIAQLITLLELAEIANLKVLVTLFDFYGDYSVLDWTLTQQHAQKVVSELKDQNALLGWDIKNEPNLDFESRGKSLVVAWLDKMVDLVKSTDANHPVTIGWSNANSAEILKDKLDFISFHYYEDLNDLAETYTSLKSNIKDKPVVITEYGMSSYSGFWKPFGASEDDQAEYHKTIQTTFAEHQIPFMSWTLYDFPKIPKEVVGRLPWRQNAQKHFGFIDERGIKKPSFKYISTKE